MAAPESDDKKKLFPSSNVATTLRRKTAISYGSFPRHIYLLMRAKFYPDQAITMSTASGATGCCKNTSCEHANNEHKIRACRAPGCRVKWKRCQVAGKCNGVHYRICKKYPDHPAAEPEWDWRPSTRGCLAALIKQGRLAINEAEPCEGICRIAKSRTDNRGRIYYWLSYAVTSGRDGR